MWTAKSSPRRRLVRLDRLGRELTSFDPTSATIQQFVQYAHDKGATVHLAVALFDSATTQTILQSYKTEMTNQIVAAVEAVPGNDTYRELYSQFLEMLAEALHAKNLELYMAVAQRPAYAEDAERLTNAGA